MLNIQGLMKQAQMMQKKMQEAQEKLEYLTYFIPLLQNKLMIDH